MTYAAMTDTRTTPAFASPACATGDRDQERPPPSERNGQEQPRQDREEGGYGSPNEGGPGGHGDWSEDEGGEDEGGEED